MTDNRITNTDENLLYIETFLTQGIRFYTDLLAKQSFKPNIKKGIIKLNTFILFEWTNNVTLT